MTLSTLNQLRDTITNAYRMDESICVNQLLSEIRFTNEQRNEIAALAKELVIQTREYKKRQGKIDALLHQYDLSSEEGIALMCLAEALLRIPDKETIDKLISDKISSVEWKSHLNRENPLFLNAATWSLILTGKIFSPIDKTSSFSSTLRRVVSKLGIAAVRPFVLQMMKAIGKEFVIGEDINEAVKNSANLQKMGYLFSYDMLGEEARTREDGVTYYEAYENALETIGQSVKSNNPKENPGISVKLSALNPRYEYKQRERMLEEVPPLLLSLAKLAKKYQLNLTVDAEEAERLDLSLDIFEKVFKDPTLDDWNGFGLAVQAYQKRAPFVIDWLSALAKQQNKSIMVRLVKGAYWDSEIKGTQVQGFKNYPVYTRKHTTDMAYLVCAQKLLAQPECFYPQFGTHNAHSVSAILAMADKNGDFEFQCLYGMGKPLYDHIVGNPRFNRPCRMYAPVGTHKNLLGYLIRRLLENGSNSSFINRLADEKTPIEQLIIDPVKRINQLAHKPHPQIPLPKDIYVHWQNSEGVDLSDKSEAKKFLQTVNEGQKEEYFAAPLINGNAQLSNANQPIYSPCNVRQVVGNVAEATDEDIEAALASAASGAPAWQATPVSERAAILENAATLLQEDIPELLNLLSREGGKCILDGIAELREAIDYCRYYAYRARHDLHPVTLPGPTGEANQLSLHPRGVVACISPWNFPAAIFLGQITAALVTGNAVIAKPAEQTPLIAFKLIQLLHRAGIPNTILQLLPGTGEVGAKVVKDPRIAGVMFTGSTNTAKSIEQTLAHRSGPIAFLIAETGGQNAMIVDSSALPEQVVLDIVQSAFNSAGQRCSALRVLFVQNEIAPRLLNMLAGYMQTLKIGDPSLLSTDIGPVIDKDAKQMLENHLAKMKEQGQLIAQVPLASSGDGLYFAPCAFEINDLAILPGEIFGPILHVIRYAARDLDKIMDTIIKTGYGLTLGIESRVDSTIHYIESRMPIGNTYVNRNMIGAVVGVQPFGGSRLSGTGPKAGGPHYLPRLCVERAVSTNTTAVGGNARLLSLLEED